MVKKFSYPDIPYIADRAMYDYLFSIDRLLRQMGSAIEALQKEISGASNGN